MHKDASGAPLRSMFTYPLMAAALLLMGVVTAILVDMHSARLRATHHTQTALSSAARQQASTLRALLEGRFALLETYAAHVASQPTFASAAIVPQLRGIAAASDFLRVWVAMPDGSAHSEDDHSVNIADRSYFQKALNGGRAVQMVRESKVDRAPLMIMAVPVMRGTTPIGVVYGSYSERIFRSFLTPRTFEQRAYTFFCDAHGEIVIASSSDLFLLRKENSNNIIDFLDRVTFLSERRLGELKADLQAGRGGACTVAIHGDSRYAVYEPLGFNDWFIFNAVPASVIAADADAATWDSVQLIAIIVLFSLLAIVLLLRHEHKSIRLLEHGKELLRVREQQYRIAADHSGKDIIRYDIQSGILHQECDCHGYFHVAGRQLHVPEFIFDSSLFTEGGKADLLIFFQTLRSGAPGASTIFCGKSENDEPRWYKAEATTVFNDAGEPVQAIISYHDVTEEQKKDLAYNQWRLKVDALPQHHIKLYTYNLTQDIPAEEEGELLAISAGDMPTAFNARTEYAANTVIHPDDHERYIALLDREQLLAHYYQGETEFFLEFQMRDRHDNYRWTRLSVRMLSARNSSDVTIFLLYQDIDDEKRVIIARKRQTELDALTGLLNRDAFARAVTALLENSPQDAQHALILLDVDQFKHVNTSYGRTVGDQTLLNIAHILKSVMRRGDVIGRLGGDEFMLCLNNLPYDAAIGKKARDLSMLMSRKMESGVYLSTSMGVTVYPRDGSDFHTLYARASAALQANKNDSREGFTIYHEGLQGEELPQATPIERPALSEETAGQPRVPQKRTLLIVDDMEAQRDILKEIFNDFRILAAVNGADALRQMRLYGSGISVVLMDIDLPDMTGLGVLQKMRQEKALSIIPVIIVSCANDMQANIEAVELGASDFVSKPFEAKLIRLRVQNVVNRRENEQLRIENSYLQLQSEEEERYRHVLYSTGTIVFECDWLNKVYVYDARASKYLAGAYDARPLPQILHDDRVASAEDVGRIENAMAHVADDSTAQGDQLTVRLKTPQGDPHWFKVHIVRTADSFNSAKKLLFTFTDVHTEMLAKEKLRYLAEYDSLTKLYNRPTFLEKVQEKLKGQPPNSYVIVYLDIDNFKAINDLFGFAEGDRLLCHVAKNLNYPSSGSIACRISADYFAALYPYDVERLGNLYRRGKASISAYALPFEVTFSVGCYVIDDPSLPVEAMLDRATLAQESIKGRYNARAAYYDENLREQLLAVQEITGSMNTALEQRQFEIYLQPQYNHATGKLVGAEALVRWNHPTKGVLLPSRFMPIFEKNGFVVKLDSYVWEQACALLRSWLDAGHTPIPLSVNVSRMDIFHSSFYTLITSLRQKYALPASLLPLEITESAYGALPSQLIEVVEKLQKQGFIIEMDDFGSGYSSLNTLKDVPVNVVKLDLRFLSDSSGSGRGERILQHVVKMTRSLGLGIIAEGVETKQQADYLLGIGCETVQGYYYGKPMPVREFEAYFL